jgi:hypothetical protein
MGVYLNPEYFQTIHYYFFCLGIFSLTSAFLFSSFGVLTYLFMVFYVANSAISWYISWFLHGRMQRIFYIKTWKYASVHVVLTLWSAGLAVMMWYLFADIYESFMSSIVMINFFVLFLGAMWYAISRFRFVEKFFEWQDREKMKDARGAVMSFRDSKGLKLVDDDTMNEYEFGKDDRLDHLFLIAKKEKSRGNQVEMADAVRDLEMGMTENRLDELLRKAEKLKKEQMSATDQQLLKTYETLIDGYRKKIVRYQQLFEQKIKK